MGIPFHLPNPFQLPPSIPPPPPLHITSQPAHHGSSSCQSGTSSYFDLEAHRPSRTIDPSRPPRQCLRTPQLHHEGNPRRHPSLVLQALHPPLHGLRRPRLLLPLRPHLPGRDLHPPPPLRRLGSLHHRAGLRLHRHLDPRTRVRPRRLLQVEIPQLHHGSYHALVPACSLPQLASLALAASQGHRQYGA